MPYVPPHLRGGASDAQDSLNSGARSSSHSNLSSFDRDRDSSSRGGGWGRDEPPRRMQKTPSAGNLDSRGPAPRRGAGPPPEPVLGKWQPSERVQKLDEEQIADIRQRLNVDVEVPEGQPAAAAPIESFVDMVSTFALLPDIASLALP